MLHPDKQNKIDALLERIDADLLLVYNGMNDEPSFGSWFLEKKLIDHVYIMYDKKNWLRVSIAWWFVELAKNIYQVDIIPALQKVDMIQYISDILSWYNRIAIAWNVPYKDYLSLREKVCIDCEQDLKDVIAHKSVYEIQSLKDIRNYAHTLLESISIETGKTKETDIADYLTQKSQKDWYDVTFLCVTWFDKLPYTTIEDPSDRVIQDNEALCIDFWLYKDGFNSDLTRCYFTGQDELQQAYKRIQDTVLESAKYIVHGRSSKEYIAHIKELSEKNNLSWYILVDLGHGIGNFYHEYPDLYHSDFVFEEGMVFTLEPEYKVGNYLLRYEDMFVVWKTGAYLIWL